MSYIDGIKAFLDLGGGGGGGDGLPLNLHVSLTNNNSVDQRNDQKVDQRGSARGSGRGHGTGGSASAGAHAQAKQDQQAEQGQHQSQQNVQSQRNSQHRGSSGGPQRYRSASGPKSRLDSTGSNEPSEIDGNLDILGRAVAKVIEQLEALTQANKAMAQVAAPTGSIVAWHQNVFGDDKKTELPEGWIPCNGQLIYDKSSPLHGKTIPDLNNKRLFIRGGKRSGDSEESAFKSHNHGGATNSTAPTVTDTSGRQMQRVQMYDIPTSGIDVYRASFAGGPHGRHENVIASAHSHAIPLEGESETRPANMSMVWIIRIK